MVDMTVRHLEVLAVPLLLTLFCTSPAPPPYPATLDIALVHDEVVTLINGIRVQPVPAVWRKWLAYDPVALEPSCKDNLRPLGGIRFGCHIVQAQWNCGSNFRRPLCI